MLNNSVGPPLPDPVNKTNRRQGSEESHLPGEGMATGEPINQLAACLAALRCLCCAVQKSSLCVSRNSFRGVSDSMAVVKKGQHVCEVCIFLVYFSIFLYVMQTQMQKGILHVGEH